MILTTHNHKLPNIRSAAPRKPASKPESQPGDSVELSGGTQPRAPKFRSPMELKDRPQAQAPDSGSGFQLGMAALAGLSLLGAASVALPQQAPAQVVVQEVQSTQQGPEFNLKQAALPEETDNATASKVRQDLSTMLDTMTEEVATYNQRLASLQLTGAKLDGYQTSLGVGQHQVGDEIVSVRGGASYSIVRVQNGEVVTQSIRNGKSRLVEVKSPTETLTLLESPGIHTVTRVEGSPLNTAGIIPNQSSHHFDAKTGLFSVQETTAFGSREFNMQGSTIDHSETYRVHGIGGDLQVTHTERIEEPEFILTLYPGTSLTVEKTRTVWNPTTGAKTESETQITVRQDGSTRTVEVRDGEKTVTEEPGVEPEGGGHVTRPEPIFFP